MKGDNMVRTIVKDGYVGGRVKKILQDNLDAWTQKRGIVKTEVIIFLLSRFLLDKKLQKQFMEWYERKVVVE